MTMAPRNSKNNKNMKDLSIWEGGREHKKMEKKKIELSGECYAKEKNTMQAY